MRALARLAVAGRRFDLLAAGHVSRDAGPPHASFIEDREAGAADPFARRHADEVVIHHRLASVHAGDMLRQLGAHAAARVGRGI